MRPQIRSIPLTEVECPQFTWVLRNNSANISGILQPDFKNQQSQNEYATGKPTSFQQEYICGNQEVECNCVDKTLQPTLFSHPVTCVCSTYSCPPKNELYRHYKLKMEDQAIGDIMEKVLLEKRPISPPSPICKGGRLFKKTMISSHAPDKLRLENENVCAECFMRESPLLRSDQNDNLIYKNLNVCNGQPRCNICIDKSKCIEDCKDYGQNYVSSFLKRPWQTDTMSNQNTRCSCGNDISICTGNREHLDRCVDCKRYMSNCEKSCAEYLRKTFLSNGMDYGLAINNNKKITTAPVDKTNDSQDGSSWSPTKSAEQNQNVGVVSPEESSGRSPVINETHWVRPGEIIDQRPEILEGSSYEDQTKEPNEEGVKETPPTMYEHFRNSKAVDSESSSRTTSKFTNSIETNSGNANNKNPKEKFLTGANSKKSKLKQKKLHKYPWNFNNQPKTEDSTNNWKGTRESRRKTTRYPKLGTNVEIGANNSMRSRAGDDYGNFTQRSGPEYFEYRPNLGLSPQEHSTETEENIKTDDQKKYDKGLGKMRVKIWHNKMDECATNFQKNAEYETGRAGRNNQSKNHKEKHIFSDDDNDNDKPNESSESIHRLETDCNDKDYNGETYNQAALSEQVNQSGKSDTYCGKLAENTKWKQKKTSDMNSSIKDENIGHHNKRKYLEKECCNLSTIFEEYSGKCDCDQEKEIRYSNTLNPSSEIGKKCSNCASNVLQYRSMSAQEQKVSDEKTPDNLRPRSAKAFREEPFQTPYFNIIRQKIHSRTNKKIEDLEKFRDEHFFETHNTEVYLPDTPKHTCVHRFTVDERLYPQPLHTNVFGISCCIHCDKPMKNEKTVFSDQRESVGRDRGTENAQKHLSKFCLRPKPVHIGSRNSVLEIQLGPEHEDLLKPEKIIEPKRTYYTNSLALRHQRR